LSLLSFRLSVEECAVPANVPLRRVGLDADAAKIGHGGDECLLEVGAVLRPRDDGGAGPAVGEEHLVGSEEPPPLHQVDEVLVVEGVRRDGVDLHRDVGVHAGGARRLQLRRVAGVQRRVQRRRLDPRRERVAVREPHSVRRCVQQERVKTHTVRQYFSSFKMDSLQDGTSTTIHDTSLISRHEALFSARRLPRSVAIDTTGPDHTLTVRVGDGLSRGVLEMEYSDARPSFLSRASKPFYRHSSQSPPGFTKSSASGPLFMKTGKYGPVWFCGSQKTIRFEI
jgi:hypothetical protein